MNKSHTTLSRALTGTSILFEKRSTLIVSIISVLFFVSRLLILQNHQATWADESHFLLAAEDILNGGVGVSFFHGELYQCIIAAFSLFIGFSFFTGKLTSTIVATLLIPLFYMFNKQLFGRKWGVVAAFLLSLNPGVFWLSYMVLTEGLFTLVVLLVFVIINRTENSKVLWGFAGFFMGLVYLTRYVGALLILCFLIFIFLKIGNLRHEKGLLIAILMIFIVLLPDFYIKTVLFGNPFHQGYTQYYVRPTEFHLAITFRELAGGITASLKVLVLLVTSIGVLFSISYIILKKDHKKNREFFIFLLLWICIHFTLHALYTGVSLHSRIRYIFPITPFLISFSIGFLKSSYENMNKLFSKKDVAHNSFTVFALLFIIIFSIASSFGTFSLIGGNQISEGGARAYKDACLWINENSNEDAIVAAPIQGSTRFHSKRTVVVLPLKEQEQTNLLQFFDENSVNYFIIDTRYGQKSPLYRKFLYQTEVPNNFHLVFEKAEDTIGYVVVVYKIC